MNDDGTVNEWGDKILETGEGRATYIGFDRLESGQEVRDAFQIKGKDKVNPLDPEDGSWSDGRIRSEFDTLQLFDDQGQPQVRVPGMFGDTREDLPEPITEAYPEFGQGGKAQLHADGQILKYDHSEVLPESSTKPVLSEKSTGKSALSSEVGSGTVLYDGKQYLNTTTQAGMEVHHGQHSTAIGNDEATMGNYRVATDTGNGHNVIVHGSRPDYDEQGGIFQVTNDVNNLESHPTHTQQIVDAVLSNPNYKAGSPVCLGSCWSGSNGTAQQVSNALNATVTATTRPVRFDTY